ncbi:helix-turn-helix domain-containing protein [Candidatus Binatia bacterium]|jgi:HTH-type transcriptional regulator/antitoxin HipB|nr:helix-turn-helix domain-containing protein [Candidatus Binatia bacterium]
MRVQTAGDLGALIRERRQKLGMDQKTLAAKAGVSRFWVIGIECGKPRAEVGLVLRTLRALGLVMDVDVPLAAHERPAARGGRTKTVAAPRVDLDALIGSLAKRKSR